MNMKSIYTTGIIIILFLCTNFPALGQDFPPWDAPASANEVKNPVPANKASIENGKAFFMVTCKPCHGEKGLGNGLIKAANLTSIKFTQQSDGSIFWKLHQGRGQMPSFKALPEEQLWNVINFVRSLSEKHETIVRKNAIVQLSINSQSNTKEVTARVLEITRDSQEIPLENIKVSFFAKRYFGNLPVAGDVTHNTNKDGQTTAIVPDSIIGDKDGILTIVASIDDMDYTPAEASELVKWGLVNPENYWTERRSLWKDNDYVPLWLLFSFGGCAIGIWAFIIYVMLQVRKIKVIGDKLNK